MTNNDLISKKEVDAILDRNTYWQRVATSNGDEPGIYKMMVINVKAKEELSQIESVNGWIDVDKHPTERVIIRGIYEGEEFTATGKIDDDSYLDELGQRVAFAEYVTHYMPLPPTPNKL